MITIDTTHRLEPRVYTYNELFDPFNRLSGKVLKVVGPKERTVIRLAVDSRYQHLIVMIGDVKTHANTGVKNTITVFDKDCGQGWMNRTFFVDDQSTVTLSNECPE